MRSPSFWTTAPPSVAVEIAPRRVEAISLVPRGTGVVVGGHAVETLPAGAVAPALNASNIPDRRVVVQALQTVLNRLPTRQRRVALVIPDSVAKVSIIRLDNVPPRAHDLDQLIRWHVRKAAPFRVEDAQVTYARGAVTEGGGQEFVVAVSRRDIVREYEQACVDAGTAAGLVDLATFSLVNAALSAAAPPSGDWLLVHVTPEYSTMAILRGSDLIFFRNRVEEGDGHLSDLVHQTAMYYEDRLSGRGFTRAVLTGTSGSAGGQGGPTIRGADAVRRSLEDRLGVRVETIRHEGLVTFADRVIVEPALFDQVAPLLGVLLRERSAA